ncbi:MAG: four helix bundle protein [Algoriphagus sp.]|jgi:four helix bundle protein
MGRHNFKKLNICKRSIDSLVDVYKLSINSPNDEKFRLTSQIHKSVISVPSHIAEGSRRGTNKNFPRFLDVSLGSAFELETLLIPTETLSLVPNEVSIFEKLINELKEIQNMVFGFQIKIK